MTLILNSVFPVLALIALGYAAKSFSLIPAKLAKALDTLAFAFLVPCLLFVSTATAEIRSADAAQYLGAYYGVTLTVFLTAALIAKHRYGFNNIRQSVYAMGAAYSNATIIGIPLVTLAFGEQALVPLLVIIALQSTTLFTAGVLTAERSHLSLKSIFNSIWHVVKKVFTNPTTASVFAGAVFNLVGLTLPELVADALRTVGKVGIPITLFMLGTALTQYHLAKQLEESAVMVSLRMLITPVAVWVLMGPVLAFPDTWVAVGVLTAAMPVGISSYVFANQYKTAQEVVASGIVMSTSLSVVLIPLWLLLLTN